VAPLVWAVPATIATLQQAATFASRGLLGREWIYAILQFPRWMLWAPVTPLIFAAARRWPLQRERLVRTLLIHTGLAVLAIIVVEGIHAQMMLVADNIVAERPPAERPPALLLTALAILTRILSGLITYAAVVAVAWTMESQRRLRAEGVRGAQLARDLADAQVHAIKMQVQPHFLFNTLHAVNVLIEREPATAARVITRLGDLLRHTLARAAVTEVPLRSELEVLTLYLDIERVRFRDRLTLDIDVPPELHSAMVPDLVLQPLAENAIKHGIGRDTGAGVVTVRARREGDMLVLLVIDTGSGPAGDVTDRVGLTTVRTRLQRLYGDRQSLRLTRGPEGGCVARIELPWREAVGG